MRAVFRPHIWYYQYPLSLTTIIVKKIEHEYRYWAKNILMFISLNAPHIETKHVELYDRGVNMQTQEDQFQALRNLFKSEAVHEVFTKHIEKLLNFLRKLNRDYVSLNINVARIKEDDFPDTKLLKLLYLITEYKHKS